MSCSERQVDNSVLKNSLLFKMAEAKIPLKVFSFMFSEHVGSVAFISTKWMMCSRLVNPKR